jgi:phosphoribosylformylglycinamidine cyclo-ligase
MKSKPKTYQSAGVNLEEADKSVAAIKHWVESTFNSQVHGRWGQFGGCFAPDLSGIKVPVLVSSTDSVGTKLLIAIQAGIHDTVGQDIVNHCVNDILTCGARPLFFLDYIGIGSLSASVVEKIVKGIAIACRQNDCVLIGGEMAEMPDIYKTGDYDLVGTIVGIVDRDRLVDGSRLVPGDVLVGFPSNGLHTNGYTLARKVLLSEAGYELNARFPELEGTLGEELLRIHRSYLPIIQKFMTTVGVKAMAHITGGGLDGNTKRVVPKGMKAEFDWSAWQVPPLFRLIQETGNIDTEEMRRVFNMGIGFVVCVGNDRVNQLIEMANSLGELPLIIGEIAKV